MGWHQIPEFDSVSSADNNPFAGSRAPSTSKVSVKLLVDDWLCRKMEKLNITVAEGYPSKSTEPAGLLWDQFVKTPRSFKWYDMHFVGYQFDLRSGPIRPTPDRWQNLQEKILKRLSLPACTVWQFMSLIGLLTATEK